MEKNIIQCSAVPSPKGEKSSVVKMEKIVPILMDGSIIDLYKW